MAVRRFGHWVIVACVGGLLASTATGQTDAPSAPAPAESKDHVLEITILPPKDIAARPGDDMRVKRIGWVKGVRYLVPDKWTVRPPSNAMRLVEMVIPEPSGSGKGDGGLMMFGDIGGSVEDNIARWVDQFIEVDGTATQQDLSIINDQIRITQVVVTGTYVPMTAAGKGEPLAGWTLFGAIVQNGPEGIVFIKATGPKDTMAARRADWDMLIRNLRVIPKPEIEGGTDAQPAKPDGEPKQ